MRLDLDRIYVDLDFDLGMGVLKYREIPCLRIGGNDEKNIETAYQGELEEPKVPLRPFYIHQRDEVLLKYFKAD